MRVLERNSRIADAIDAIVMKESLTTRSAEIRPSHVSLPLGMQTISFTFRLNRFLYLEFRTTLRTCLSSAEERPGKPPSQRALILRRHALFLLFLLDVLTL